MRYFGRQEYRDLNSIGVDNAGNIEISYFCYQRPDPWPGLWGFLSCWFDGLDAAEPWSANQRLGRVLRSDLDHDGASGDSDVGDRSLRSCSCLWIAAPRATIRPRRSGRSCCICNGLAECADVTGSEEKNRPMDTC